MNKVMVKINGAEYPMVGEKSEQHMISVASYVDKEMSKVIESNPRLSSSVAAIVTAVNITDILFECSHENEELTKKNEELSNKAGSSDEEIQLEMTKLQILLKKKEKEEEDYNIKIKELNKVIENQKSQIKDLGNRTESTKEEVDSYKCEIEELKTQLEEAEEKAVVAEKLSSKFQNDAYKVQLEKIEIENEVKYLRAKK